MFRWLMSGVIELAITRSTHQSLPLADRPAVWTSPELEGFRSFMGSLRTISCVLLSPFVLDVMLSILGFPFLF
jgi:hypothetical protein